MRTTLALDEDVLELATQLAKARGPSLGKAVSDLVRRGLNAHAPTADKEWLGHLPTAAGLAPGNHRRRATDRS